MPPLDVSLTLDMSVFGMKGLRLPSAVFILIVPLRYRSFDIGYSPIIVRPSDEATALKLVSVVELDGTYTLLVVPLFFVTKLLQISTNEELI